MKFILIAICFTLTVRAASQTLAFKNKIVLALYAQESSSGKDTINETDRDSKGYFQMRDSTVDDVNRILKKRKLDVRFTYQDRFNFDKSVLMVFYWSQYYTPDWCYEDVSRKWGCGPAAIRLNKCQDYWKKTQEILKN